MQIDNYFLSKALPNQLLLVRFCTWNRYFKVMSYPENLQVVLCSKLNIKSLWNFFYFWWNYVSAFRHSWQKKIWLKQNKSFYCACHQSVSWNSPSLFQQNHSPNIYRIWVFLIYTIKEIFCKNSGSWELFWFGYLSAPVSDRNLSLSKSWPSWRTKLNIYGDIFYVHRIFKVIQMQLISSSIEMKNSYFDIRKI